MVVVVVEEESEEEAGVRTGGSWAGFLAFLIQLGLRRRLRRGGKKRRLPPLLPLPLLADADAEGDAMVGSDDLLVAASGCCSRFCWSGRGAIITALYPPRQGPNAPAIAACCSGDGLGLGLFSCARVLFTVHGFEGQ